MCGGSALRVGLHQHEHDARAQAVRDPHLLAVELPVAVVELLGGRLDALDVRADLGLRQREGGAELAGGHPREELLLLLVGAELHQQVGADEVGVDDARDRDPAARELLDDHRVGREVEPHPAVLLGDRDAEQPELLHLLDHGVGELVLVVVLLGDREDLVVDELAHHLGDGLLLVGLLGEARGYRHCSGQLLRCRTRLRIRPRWLSSRAGGARRTRSTCAASCSSAGRCAGPGRRGRASRCRSAGRRRRRRRGCRARRP